MKDSELILNDDNSIYHLALCPEDIGSIIVTVGDPERVKQVSAHFDEIQIQKSKREFVTHTGLMNGKRITCLSTGMGSDNIDIVMNELDALVNIDFNTRRQKQNHTALTIVRIGTSGSISHQVDVNDVICTEIAIGLEGLMLWYEHMELNALESMWVEQLGKVELPIKPFVCAADEELLGQFNSKYAAGVTLTTAGFYAPQSRSLRLKTHHHDLIGSLAKLNVGTAHITNIEMETAAIYGLSKALGHKAISINVILANRIKGEFSDKAQHIMDETIGHCLNILCAS